MSDDFFSNLGNDKPYMKIAFEGFAGCGKTYTAADIAIGLHARIGSAKPIIIFDTELSAKFLGPRLRNAGIPAQVKSSRSMADLKDTMARLRDGYADILIIDSISHVWEDFIESYKRRVKRNRLEFQDWGIIKPTWKAEFSDPLVRDPYHILMTGRAGYEYENEKNPDTGKREIYKSGIKMKVEGETAYEPDILVLMERFEEVLTETKQVWREATILKDRSSMIDGKTFRDPTYADFAPAIEAVLSEPVPRSTIRDGDAGSLFRTEEDKREWTRRRDIALEKIQAAMVRRWPGQSAADKKAKADCLMAVFGTGSWIEVSTWMPNALERCCAALESAYSLGAGGDHADPMPPWGA